MEEQQLPEKKKRDARSQKQSINVDMNPMVDLAFLLLTFFMLATTFSQPQAMELVMPVQPDADEEEQQQAVKESKALSLVLTEKDKVYWYQGVTKPEVYETICTGDNLKEVLLEKQATIDGLVVLIKPDSTSRYENLIDLLDEINTTGIQRYAITELTPEDQTILTNFKNK